MSSPYTLVLLRHGESEWNAKNLFTGWVDVDLTAKGEAEAARGGRLVAEAGVLPDVVHTSVQRRAIRTAQLALDAADRHWIPVRRSWRLNERHYGALQGKDKKQTLDEFGEEQFMLWRRSYDTPPPPLADDDPYSQAADPRYAGLPSELRPRDGVPGRRRRADAAVLVRRDRPGPPQRLDGARRGPRQLAACSGEAPRRHLRRRDRGAQHPHGHPAGVPARRRRPADLPGGEYLDPDAAAAAIEAVKNQGR